MAEQNPSIACRVLIGTAAAIAASEGRTPKLMFFAAMFDPTAENSDDPMMRSRRLARAIRSRRERRETG